MTDSESTKPQLGISACLLGHEVRFDGGHKRDRYITRELAEHFEFTTYCPEAAMGMGIPRPPVRLVGGLDDLRMLEVKDDSRDHTEGMLVEVQQSCTRFGNISGYILKSRSPSCGMERVKRFSPKGGMPEHDAVGLFAAELMRQHPNLPVEEEGRLHDAHLRENFIERVYAYQRWQTLVTQGLSPKALMAFHRQHKWILLSHDETRYRRLGPLVASANKQNMEEVAEQYLAEFMAAMRQRTTRRRHMNVLQHSFGFIKRQLSKAQKQEVGQVLERYRKGQLPLVVPLTLLRFLLSQYPNAYLEEQYYLAPYPEELMLRNHLY